MNGKIPSTSVMYAFPSLPDNSSVELREITGDGSTKISTVNGQSPIVSDVAVYVVTPVESIVKATLSVTPPSQVIFMHHVPLNPVKDLNFKTLVVELM